MIMPHIMKVVALNNGKSKRESQAIKNRNNSPNKSQEGWKRKTRKSE